MILGLALIHSSGIINQQKNYPDILLSFENFSEGFTEKQNNTRIR